MEYNEDESHSSFHVDSLMDSRLSPKQHVSSLETPDNLPNKNRGHYIMALGLTGSEVGQEVQEILQTKLQLDPKTSESTRRKHF